MERDAGLRRALQQLENILFLVLTITYYVYVGARAGNGEIFAVMREAQRVYGVPGSFKIRRGGPT